LCGDAARWLRQAQNGAISAVGGLAVSPSSGEILWVDWRLHRVTSMTVEVGSASSKWLGGVVTPSSSWSPVIDPAAAFEGSSMVADAAFQPVMAVDVDHNSLYVMQVPYNSMGTRLMRFELDSGVYRGWVGRVLLPPTGGDAGCVSASVGAFAPGWCLGGMGGSGYISSPTMFSSPDSMAAAPATNAIYFVDGSTIKRMAAGTGQFNGWTGIVGALPTGGAAGCSSTPIGTMTPGWCTGGRGGVNSSAVGDGNLSQHVPGMAVDGVGNAIFVADADRHRVLKFDLTSGAFVGWIGKIDESPTGGMADCVGATGYTPGWCIGGTTASGAGSGELTGPCGIAVDSVRDALFVADGSTASRPRVVRFQASTGCAGAPIGTVTPGWCVGGQALSGAIDGACGLLRSHRTAGHSTSPTPWATASNC